MRNIIKPALAAVAIAAAVLGSIGSALAQPMPIPELRPEGPPPPPPGANHLWEPGHWHWNGTGYVWVGGHYIVRERAWRGEFVPGRWDRRGAEWVWVPGHWR
jgi:hypothetical protein